MSRRAYWSLTSKLNDIHGEESNYNGTVCLKVFVTCFGHNEGFKINRRMKDYAHSWFIRNKSNKETETSIQYFVGKPVFAIDANTFWYRIVQFGHTRLFGILIQMPQTAIKIRKLHTSLTFRVRFVRIRYTKMVDGKNWPTIKLV